jgi:hypothetical protein
VLDQQRLRAPVAHAFDHMQDPHAPVAHAAASRADRRAA